MTTTLPKITNEDWDEAMREEDENVDTAEGVVTNPPTSPAPAPPSQQQPSSHDPSSLGHARSSDHLETKASILETKPNARWLGGTAIAFSRPGEEADSLVVRDLNTLTEFDHVELKGVQNIETLMYILLRVLHYQSDELFERLKYGVDELNKLLDGLSDDHVRGWKTIADLKIGIKNLETCPQIYIYQFDESKGVLTNGIYLFVTQTINLIKHINTIHSIDPSECLLFPARQPLRRYKD